MSQTFLSERIHKIAESQTIAMAKKARELAASGVDVINLTLGEPDFVTPKYICEAANKAIAEGFTFYTPVAGTLDLRQAIAEKLKRDNSLSYAPDQIVVSTGAKQSIANAALCLLNPGDEAVILGPYWVSYLEIVKMAEGTPVVVNGTPQQGFKPTLAEIEAAITPKTKLLLYSSPSNPTGAVFTKAELDAIAAMLQKYPQVFVISDEIYEYISFGESHYSIAQAAGMYERTAVINGFSKGFAMTGWRVGYLAGPKWLASATDKLQGQFTSGTCSIAQKAATGALVGDMTPTREMRDAFLRRRDLMLREMGQIPNLIIPVPDGAFYLFPDVSAYYGKTAPNGQVIANSNDMAMYLLADAAVSAVSGDAFGADNCVRFSFAAADDKLIEAAARIKKALAALA